jgi:signal transduction histidine kinase
VLRGSEPQPLAPAPTVRQVHRLVARTRAEGLPVELRIEGQANSLPPGIDVSAYRVVEEGLAGLRERGVRQVRVTMRYGDGETEVEVRGEPTQAASPAESRSWLATIRERVAICGGELRSGDGPARELFIRARLPHGARPTIENVRPERPASPTLVATPPGSGACTRILADAAVGLALFAALALDAFTGGQRHGPAVLNVLAFAAIAASVAWIPRAPLRAAAVFAATAVLLTDYLTPLPKLDTAQVALVLVTYLTAATTAGRQAALAFAVLAGGVMAVTLIYGIGNLASRQVYALVTLALLAWVAGRATRSRALLNRALREKAQALELERDERARAAGAQVRRQVARELHDVVAHGLTVMIVQAGSARRLASSNPAEALGATELIETTGREALGEMRRLLDVMSDEDGAPRAAPPGMESIEALLDRSRAAGLAVELHTDGPARPLPTGVDLAAYRVVQEALTNTIKHAAASHAELLVRYRDDALELLVADNGHGPLRPLTGPGHGLVGMRERVGVYGGELHAGRDERGGFRVRARFPLEPTK